jgi:membrane protease subunit HflK
MADQAKKPKGFKISAKIVILGVIGAILIAAFSTGFFVVGAPEEGVITRFGAFDRIVGPGPQFVLPFGIEQYYIVNTTEEFPREFGFQTLSSGVNSVLARGDYTDVSSMLTGDLNFIDITWVIRYQIIDPQAWLFNVENDLNSENNREKTIADVSISIMNQLVGDRSVSIVQSGGREEIAAMAKTQMNDLLDRYGLGIRINQVQITGASAPVGRVQEAFTDLQNARQDRDRLINEAEETINTEIPKARGIAQQQIAQARGYAAQRVNNANGDVARFRSVLQEYLRNPETTRTRLYLETMEQIFADENKTTLIDKDLTSVIPLLNLNGGATQ